MHCSSLSFFSNIRPSPIVTLFPYTTLFRSVWFSSVMHPRFHEAELGKREEQHEGKEDHRDRAGIARLEVDKAFPVDRIDRKSTRLNSSHVAISYAVFCLKKKNIQHEHT